MLLGGKSYAFATQKLCFYTLLIISMLQQYFSKKTTYGKIGQFSHTWSALYWGACRLVVLLFSDLVV